MSWANMTTDCHYMAFPYPEIAQVVETLSRGKQGTTYQNEEDPSCRCRPGPTCRHVIDSNTCHLCLTLALGVSAIIFSYSNERCYWMDRARTGGKCIYLKVQH